jgi:hypothetical protein
MHPVRASATLVFALSPAACAVMGGAPTRTSDGVLTNEAGKPLYLWITDKKPGERTGDGFNDVWHVAKP